MGCDGGGCRGYIANNIFQYMEALTGKPFHELYDLMGGTSIGGIFVSVAGQNVAEGKNAEVVENCMTSAFEATLKKQNILRMLCHGYSCPPNVLPEFCGKRWEGIPFRHSKDDGTKHTFAM